MSRAIKLLKTEKLSNINQDIAQAFFASAFLAPLLTKTADVPSIALGFSSACIFWSISLYPTYKKLKP